MLVFDEQQSLTDYSAGTHRLFHVALFAPLIDWHKYQNYVKLREIAWNCVKLLISDQSGGYDESITIILKLIFYTITKHSFSGLIKNASQKMVVKSREHVGNLVWGMAFLRRKIIAAKGSDLNLLCSGKFAALSMLQIVPFGESYFSYLHV